MHVVGSSTRVAFPDLPSIVAYSRSTRVARYPDIFRRVFFPGSWQSEPTHTICWKEDYSAKIPRCVIFSREEGVSDAFGGKNESYGSVKMKCNEVADVCCDFRHFLSQVSYCYASICKVVCTPQDLQLSKESVRGQEGYFNKQGEQASEKFYGGHADSDGAVRSFSCKSLTSTSEADNASEAKYGTVVVEDPGVPEKQLPAEGRLESCIKSRMQDFSDALGRPLIFLEAGPDGRLSRVLNEYFTPSCLEGEERSNAWGQLSALSLFRERERQKLPCVNFFLFGFPTISSPSPTVHNSIFALRPATKAKCIFSLFPPPAVQHELLQLNQYGGKSEKLPGQDSHQTEHLGQEKGAALRQDGPLVERMVWQYLRAAPLKSFGGACVTIPLKESVAPLLNHIHPVAQEIGAVNTIYRNDTGDLCGANTDYAAIVKAILLRCPRLSRSSSFLVLGAGGAARAAVYACKLVHRLVRDEPEEDNADGSDPEGNVFILNRTRSRGAALAEELGVEILEVAPDGDSPSRPPLLPQTGLPGPRRTVKRPRFHVVVGTIPGSAQLAIPELVWREQPLVLEMAYRPVLTPLVKKACGAGCSVVHGIELFVWQALIQARYFIGSQLGEETPAIVSQANERSSVIDLGSGWRLPGRQRLLKKWKTTAEGLDSLPLKFSREEMGYIVRTVRDFYRREVDFDHIVCLREEEFLS